MRPKIAQQRVSDSLQAFRPGFKRGNMICCDAQNLDI
jgi:hypothetical protein